MKVDCYHCEEGCDIPTGICHCGCGRTTPKTTGAPYPKGTYWKFVAGHQALRGAVASDEREERRKVLKEKVRAYQEDGTCPWCEGQCAVGASYCHCGCGQRTAMHDKTSVMDGKMLGLPCKWVHNHNHRRAWGPQEVRRARYLYAVSDVTQDELAEMFDVSRRAVREALNYETFVEAGIATSEETA